MQAIEDWQGNNDGPGAGLRGTCTAAGISVPAAVRAIFAVWAQECDPAPLLPRNGDAHALVAAYLLLSAQAAPVPLDRCMLAQVYLNAALNRDFAMWSELRQEAAAVLAWLAPIVADDPAMRELIVLAWRAGTGDGGGTI